MEISTNLFFSRLMVSRYYRLLQFLRLRLADQDGGHGLVLVLPTQTEYFRAFSKGVFNVISLLYKLTVLSSLGNLLEVVICPAVAGIQQVSLIIPDGFHRNSVTLTKVIAMDHSFKLLLSVLHIAFDLTNLPFQRRLF